MTQPLTGTTPAAGGYLNVDNRLQGGHRTGLIAVLFRDARGAATNISPHLPNGSVNWSPLAQDGQLRDDLFAQKLENGFWVPNPDPNEGWYLAGAFGEGNGPSQRPSIDTDDQMIEQSNWPFESDMTKQDEPFSFQALQNLQPAIQRLLNNLPLSDALGNSLVELPGEPDAGWSQIVDAEKIGRQFLLYGIRKKNGQYLYEVDAYDYATLTNKDERRLGKRGTAASLTFKPEPSNYFMAMVDGEYKPIIKHTFVGGPAWEAQAEAGS
ncbi:major tail protein [Mycobacterium phage Brujita]|uniref:Major tail protein n=2 Tax=Brujitavirus brujita TaxID=561996 RepID=B5U381_9CAUD|nr:major tail protein [Mycobacterium phage Brujita]ACI06227.1 major tail protein [Mycobacterium phage Brujita]ADL71197.1 major tail protein [Mycobacterium phage Island3]